MCGLGTFVLHFLFYCNGFTADNCQRNQLPDNVVATRDLSSFKKKLAECLGDALYRFHQ